MRILYIQDSLGTGGAERSNAELWYFLKENGVQIKIVVLEHRIEGVEQEILDVGFEVNFLKPGSFFQQVLEIRKVVKEFEPHLVHSVLFKAAMRTRSAKLLTNFTNVESLVNFTYAPIRYQDPKINSKILGIYEKLDRFSHRFGVDHFIAITTEVKKHYQEHLKIESGKISVIPRGRKENKFIRRKSELRMKLKEEIGLNPDNPIFIHVGRQEFQKGHLDILKAIKLIDEDLVDKGVQFLLCGRKGNASAAIENYLLQNDIQTELKFLGHRNDIYELLAASDVFIFPSLFEGLGGSLIEAQAAGLPIICSDISVFNEVVTSRNALFHKVNNPKSLSEQFLKILQVDLEKMGELSLKNYYERFQLEKINKDILNLYNKII